MGSYLLYVIRLGISYSTLKSLSQYSNFQMWKQISMPDFYEIVFDDNYIAKNLKRDIEDVDNLFYVK